MLNVETRPCSYSPRRFRSARRPSNVILSRSRERCLGDLYVIRRNENNLRIIVTRCSYLQIETSSRNI
jgi:hypothetical protein